MKNGLPGDMNEPFVVNGIKFANRGEYDRRVESDALQLAQLIYDIYRGKKLKEQKDVAQ